MSPAWLLRDGEPFAAAFVLSHEAQRDQLAAAVPRAASIAVVAGDPCYDRMRESRRLRDRYRRAWGLKPDSVLVTLSSTWGTHSLLGTWPELPRRLLAELPTDTHQVMLALHPNTWHAHGPYQVRSWYADCVRAGMVLVPPDHGWQQAVLAADVVVGDHGAVTGYAAALGRPTLLAANPHEELVPGTAIDALSRTAPRLRGDRSLRGQLQEAVRDHGEARFAHVTALTSSFPGTAAHRLRALFYRLMKLAEPSTEPPVHVLPVPAVPPRREPAAALVAGSVSTVDEVTARLQRYPAEMLPAAPDVVRGVEGHLVAHRDHPLRTLRAAAAVLYCEEGELDVPADVWLADTLRAMVCCRLAAVLEDAGSCLVYDGRDLIRFTPADANPPAVTCASFAYLWLAHGHRLCDVPQRIHVDVGHGPHPVDAAVVASRDQ